MELAKTGLGTSGDVSVDFKNSTFAKARGALGPSETPQVLRPSKQIPARVGRATCSVRSLPSLQVKLTRIWDRSILVIAAACGI